MSFLLQYANVYKVILKYIISEISIVKLNNIDIQSNRWKNVIRIHNIIFRCKEEWNPVICCKMEETGWHYVKYNKPDTERQAKHIFLSYVEAKIRIATTGSQERCAGWREKCKLDWICFCCKCTWELSHQTSLIYTNNMKNQWIFHKIKKTSTPS